MIIKYNKWSLSNKQAEKLISCKYYKHNSKRSDISKRTNRSETSDVPENSDRNEISYTGKWLARSDRTKYLDLKSFISERLSWES